MGTVFKTKQHYICYVYIRKPTLDYNSLGIPTQHISVIKYNEGNCGEDVCEEGDCGEGDRGEARVG